MATAKTKSAAAAKGVRRYNRTTILTTDRKTFNKVRNLKNGESMLVEFPNDIISSAHGGSSTVHHSVRRVSLIRRQANAGYSRVKVRYEQGHELDCLLVGKILGSEDSNVGQAAVCLATPVNRETLFGAKG